MSTQGLGLGGDPKPPINVTVIGGYLGSGKTTLVNHLLREAEERIVVLVNDFGDVNIDAALIESQSDDTIELSNGCICCSMIDGFSAALDRVAEIEPAPARLVIEASGVADTATVAAYGHGPGLILDAVIVTADVETIRDAADDRYVAQTIRQQLSAADVIVANKADLVTADELDATLAWLRAGWPDAFLVTAEHSRVAGEVLFGHASHRRPVPDQQELAHLFETYTIDLDRPIERKAIEQLMDELGPSTVRVKGIVELTEPAGWHVLQRVGARWSLRPAPSALTAARLQQDGSARPQGLPHQLVVIRVVDSDE